MGLLDNLLDGVGAAADTGAKMLGDQIQQESMFQRQLKMLDAQLERQKTAKRDELSLMDERRATKGTKEYDDAQASQRRAESEGIALDSAKDKRAYGLIGQGRDAQFSDGSFGVVGDDGKIRRVDKSGNPIDLKGESAADFEMSQYSPAERAKIEKDKSIAAKNEKLLDLQIRKASQADLGMLPQGDGTIMLYDKATGKSKGLMTDAEGKPVMGKKDLSESQLALAKSYFDEGSAGLKAAAQSGDKKEMEAAQEKLDMGRQILLGGKDAAKPAPQDVKVGGVVIGQATTAEEAQKLVAEYRAKNSGPAKELPATPAAPTQAAGSNAQYPYAGYATIASAIAGAKRGDSKALKFLKSLPSNELTIGEAKEISKL